MVQFDAVMAFLRTHPIAIVLLAIQAIALVLLTVGAPQTPRRPGAGRNGARFGKPGRSSTVPPASSD